MDPWPRCAVGGLERLDFVIALQRQRNFIKPLQQAVTPSWIDLKSMRLSGRRNNRLRFEVDTDSPGALRDLDLRGETIGNRLVDHDRQNSVLETIGEEDIAKARADHGANAHLLQRPYRAFTCRSAAEIWSRDENFGLPVGLAVQDEFGVLRTVG